MKHLIRVIAATTLVAGALLGFTGNTSTATTAASSGEDADNGDNGDDLIRWDLIHLNPTTLIALPGGAASSRDTATGDILRVTGSGQFDADDEEVSGGGRLVHRLADGSVAARAAYVATDMISWQPLAGSIEGTPIIDGVAEKQDARSGILTVEIAVYVRGKHVTDATLAVHCALPGAPPGTHEGVTVKVDGGPNFSEMVDHGPTIFHTLDD
jgi:hypothetical protein